MIHEKCIEKHELKNPHILTTTKNLYFEHKFAKFIKLLKNFNVNTLFFYIILNNFSFYFLGEIKCRLIKASVNMNKNKQKSCVSHGVVRFFYFSAHAKMCHTKFIRLINLVL